MRVSVLVFPGTNCEQDITHLYRNILGADHQIECNEIWHRQRDLKNPDIVIIPGGFSYGDYLRCGALAKISPVIESVKAFANKGGAVLGICNGFQILCEAGLLPGALLVNQKRRFLSQFVEVGVESNKTPFTNAYSEKDSFICPIAHFEGNYFIDSNGLKEIEDNQQVIFRYKRNENPNGSLNDIAGICNKKRNVVGLMPHPERSSEDLTANGLDISGRKIFLSSLEA